MDAGVKGRFGKLLADWVETDGRVVTDFNRAHVDDKPTIEAEVEFLQLRTAHTAIALATALRMLSETEDDGK